MLDFLFEQYSQVLSTVSIVLHFILNEDIFWYTNQKVFNPKIFTFSLNSVIAL